MENNKWIETPESSLLSGYRYDHVNQILFVGFRSNDSQYAYFDVPNFEVNLIKMNPHTAGKTIKHNIIDSKKYKFQKQ